MRTLRKMAKNHKFQVVVHTAWDTYEDEMYATKAYARKRLSDIVNGLDEGDTKLLKRYPDFIKGEIKVVFL